MLSKKLQTVTIMLIIIASCITCISIITYQISAQSIKLEVKNAYNVSLLNTRERIETYFKNLNQLTLQFETVPEVEQLIQGNRDRVDMVALLKMMTRLHASVDHVDNLILYNPRSKELLSTNGSNNALYDNYQPIIDTFAKLNKPEAFMTMRLNGLPVSVFMRKLPVFSEVQTVYMMYQINRSLFDTILGMNTYNKSGSYIIFDDAGQLVANRGLFDDQAAARWIGSIQAGAGTAAGDTSAVINTNDTFVTYLAPSYNGWSYAFAIASGTFLHNALELRDVTLRISLLLFAAAIVLAFVSSHWLWRGWQTIKSLLDNKAAAVEAKSPHNEFDLYLSKVQTIVNRSQYLQRQSEEMLPQLKEAICLSVLENGARAPETLHKIKQYGIPFKEGCFGCFCVAIDLPREAEQMYSEWDVATLEYAIVSVVKEVVEEEGSGFAVNTLKGCAAAVVSREDGSPELLADTIERMTGTIRRFVKQHFPITVSIGIGRIRSDVSHLNVCYGEAREMLNRKLIAGGDHIYWPDEAQEGTADPSFPFREMENDIFYGIRTRNREMAYEALEQLYALQARDDVPYKWFQSKMIEVAQAIIHQFRDRYPELGVHEPTVDELLRLEGLDGWIEWMRRVCIDGCLELLQEMHQTHVVSVVNKIEEFVTEHAETDLQMEAVCKELGIPVSFARQALKDERGMTFSDTVVRARIERAKRWLETEEYSVDEIARRLQYSNAQNFSRMFKKEEGVTPGQYRAGARGPII